MLSQQLKQSPVGVCLVPEANSYLCEQTAHAQMGMQPVDVQPSNNCNLSRYSVVVDRKLLIVLCLSGKTIGRKVYTEELCRTFGIFI